jgi:hypothetical protein
VCEDARQYVPETGQSWTTPAGLAADHRNVVGDDHGLVGIGSEPSFAIGQRALLVPLAGGRNLLWDCISLLDAETVAAVEEAGGLAGIAISHPHYFSAMVDWGRRFDCPVWVHAADREWVMRPDPVVELWEGETLGVAPGVTLVRCGGHFPGGGGRPGGRAAQRRHRPGHPRPALGVVHVVLPQPGPAGRARGARDRLRPVAL